VVEPWRQYNSSRIRRFAHRTLHPGSFQPLVRFVFYVFRPSTSSSTDLDGSQQDGIWKSDQLPLLGVNCRCVLQFIITSLQSQPFKSRSGKLVFSQYGFFCFWANASLCLMICAVHRESHILKTLFVLFYWIHSWSFQNSRSNLNKDYVTLRHCLSLQLATAAI